MALSGTVRTLGAMRTVGAMPCAMPRTLRTLRTMSTITVYPQHAFERSEFLQGCCWQSAFCCRQLLRQCGRHLGGHAGLHQGLSLTQTVATTDHNDPLAMALLQQRTTAARILQPPGQGPVRLHHHWGHLERRFGLIKLSFHDLHDRLRIFGRGRCCMAVLIGRMNWARNDKQVEQD